MRIIFGALLAASLFAAGTARAATLDGTCRMLAKGPDGKIAQVADQSQVTEAISASPRKPLMPPDGYSGASILCERDDLVPGGNDYRVLQMGYSLLIKTSEGGATRAGALEIKGGVIVFRLYPGTVASASEVTRLKTAIDMLQADYDASPDTPKAAP